MPAPTTISARARASTLGAGACAVALVLGAGCSDLSGVDRRIDRLLEQGVVKIDGGAVAPDRTFAPVDQYRSPGQLERRPPTINPRAEELSYQVAAQDRDVAARLEEYYSVPPDAMRLTLAEAFRISQASAREYKAAEEDYILTAIRLLIQRHLWGPRFFNDLSADVIGSFDGDSETAVRVVNELRATQRLPYGGEVEARLIWQATEQLRDAATDDYVQSTALILSGNIPLLRDAGLIAQEDLIQAQRDLIYGARDFEQFRREFLVAIATDYFDLVAQLSAIESQVRSLESREESLARAQARVQAGKDPASEARGIEQDVLLERSRLINQRELHELALNRFKIRLGIPVETPAIIDPIDFDLPEPEASPAASAALALQYRLDLQNRRDQIDDARRAVANAKNQLLPDLDLRAEVATDTPFEDRIGGFDLRFDRAEYVAGVTFGLPLDRELERLDLRAAVIGLERTIRNYEQFRDNIILDARRQRRLIDQERFNLRLSEERVVINQLRIEQLEIQEVGGLELRRAQDDLLAAELDSDNALRDLRNSILAYLLATGQLRVAPDGTFEPLPGMLEGIAPREGIIPPGEIGPPEPTVPPARPVGGVVETPGPAAEGDPTD